MLKSSFLSAVCAFALIGTTCAADAMKAPGGDYRKVSELVKLPDFLPGMGTLYVQPKTLPAGPFLAYDRDGKLDLFIGGYFSEQHNLWRRETTRIMPESVEYAKNGGRKYLLGNVSQGAEARFQDVTDASGIRVAGYGMGAAAADVEGDGDVDLYVTAFGADQLFVNRGDGTFTDGTTAAGLGNPLWGSLEAVKQGRAYPGHPATWFDAVDLEGANLVLDDIAQHLT